MSDHLFRRCQTGLLYSMSFPELSGAEEWMPRLAEIMSTFAVVEMRITPDSVTALVIVHEGETSESLEAKVNALKASWS